MPDSSVDEQAPLWPRWAEPLLEEALADSPVVLIHGPRQCGKTTLARRVGERRGYAYLTFDDIPVRDAAQSDPQGFFDGLPERVILDEVQRVPDLFIALKREVDRRRSPGRFLLTGSANVLLLPKLADSLAGRMDVLRLHPLSQGELAGGQPRFLDSLFKGSFPFRQVERLKTDLPERIVRGGYPAAIRRLPGRRRAAWYRDYLEALMQRDVQDLARIGALSVLPKLLGAAAAQTAGLFNVSTLAAPFEVSRPTIQAYTTLLERLFLLEILPPWHDNRLSRLIKTPKLHLGDTGLACALLRIDTAALEADRSLLGRFCETFVFQELRRQADASGRSCSFHHYRDKDGSEVDIVMEGTNRKIAGVEVKASATVTGADFKGLRKLKEAVSGRFAGGVVLYDGETSLRFEDRLFAVPLRLLWEEGSRKPGA